VQKTLTMTNVQQQDARLIAMDAAIVAAISCTRRNLKPHSTMQSARAKLLSDL
jgi:hypothetical protein